MKKKRKLSFALALILIGSAGFSCTDTIISDEESTADDTNTPQPETVAETDAIDLPEGLDYQGYEFRIYGITGAAEQWASDTQTGEVLNDAVYERNRAAEERLHVKFLMDLSGTDIKETAEKIRSAVMAQSDDFDMTVEHVIFGPNNTLEGVYLNLYDLKYLDFAKPWWPQQTLEELTLNGKMFLGSSMATATALDGSKTVVANKDQLAAHAIDIPYQAVYNGTWTLDFLISLSKDVYTDLNGDSKRDVDDLYGYTTQVHQNGYIVSCDIPVLEKGDDGSLTISAYSDKMVWLVETLYDWYYDSVGTYKTDSGGGNYYDVFTNGNALFGFSTIGSIRQKLRDSSINYAILPQPKYDEKQENYRTFASEHFFCVPITNQDTDRTSAVIEALSYEGYKTVVPAFYELTLKGKLADTDDDIRMLEIINNTRTISFAYIYDNWEGFGHLFSNIFNGSRGKKDYSSFYKNRLNKATKRAEKIAAAFQDTSE